STSAPRRTGPARSLRSSPRESLNSDLQLDQPIRGFGQDGELGKLPAHHCDFITAVKSWAHVAVFVDLVGKVLALRALNAHWGEKLRAPGEKTDAGHTMLFGFGH